MVVISLKASASVLNSVSPAKVAVGQADGIQPRTIEVLQVHTSLPASFTTS